MAPIKYRTADVDGFKVFYREAGAADAPKLLLLHGFPSAGHMFRDLIPFLADRFHIVAPDLPGFGQSDMPPREKFSYTFDNIAGVIDQPAGSTRTAYLTKRSCRRMVRTSTIFIWPVPARMKCNSISSAITRATSHCIRHSRNTSETTSHRFWRRGARTIRSLCRPAPRRSSGIIPARSSASSTPATSPWKPMPARSPKASAIS